MLPEAKHEPSCTLKRRGVSGVASPVAFELRRPVRLVRAGQSTVHWTLVPEAPVDEHRDLSPSEDDVGAYGVPVEHETQVAAVSQARGVQ